MKDELAYEANHVYREGYDDGFDDGTHTKFGQDLYDDMASAVGLFIAQCGEMAEKNWCGPQVEMLHWLFGAVLSGKEYADYAEQMRQEQEND